MGSQSPNLGPMPAGLESSGASSGPGSPMDDHHIHPMSSLSASPPSTSSDCGSSTSSCRRQSLGQLDSPKEKESYREKRKKNNDAARKSREKRRLNDVAMEAKLLELTRENDRLKSRLNTLETTDLKPLEPPTPVSVPTSSVIMLGPSATNPTGSMPSSFFASHLPSFPTFGSLPPAPDFGYQSGFDFNFAAAAAAAGFKMPPANSMSGLPGSSIFSNHLLAAAAAALPSFMHAPQPPPPPSYPSDPVPSGFLASTSRSAFHRPSVVEMTPAPAPPRPSMTSELAGSRPTSVIQGGVRPSVVQSSASATTSTNGCTLLDLSQSTTPMISSAPGGRIQFVGSLPLASEPRSSIFSASMEPRTLPPLANLEMPTTSVFSGAAVIKPNLNPVPPTTTQSSSLLGSLLAANRVSPTVPQSRTEQQSGLATVKSETVPVPESANADSDLPLAVQLHSSAACSSSASSCSSTNGHNKSDTDSLGSPQSMRSGSEEIQLQENKSENSGKKKGPDLERYRDRRRRNNEAAKRCRANRRAAFEYRSKRSQQLEIENGELRQEFVRLNTELDRLKNLITTTNTILSIPTTS